MNVILDTNIWVSGLLWGGPPGRILDLAAAKQISVYISVVQLEEIDRTLAKPKLPGSAAVLRLYCEAVRGW